MSTAPLRHLLLNKLRCGGLLPDHGIIRGGVIIFRFPASLPLLDLLGQLGQLNLIELSVVLISWRTLRLLHNYLTLLEGAYLKELVDESSESEVIQLAEHLVGALQDALFDQSSLTLKQVLPQLLEIVFVEDGHLGVDLTQKPGLHGVEYVRALLVKVQDISLGELGSGLRQHDVSFMAFQEDAAGDYDIDLIRLEEEQGVPMVKLHSHLVHDLNLPLQSETAEK